MRQVGYNDVQSPLGEFTVSTTHTVAGGAPPTFSMFGSDADYADETPWPYETMVFRKGNRIGLYHAAYATEIEAKAGHLLMVDTVKNGYEFGGGVEGERGNPCQSTIDEWKSRLAVKS